jgi:hypothetical protein
MFSLNISSITELLTLFVEFAISIILVVNISSNFFFSSLEISEDKSLDAAAFLFFPEESAFIFNFSILLFC